MNGKKVEFDGAEGLFPRTQGSVADAALHAAAEDSRCRPRVIDLEIYDPLYFVAFEFDEKDPITLKDAPPNCKLNTVKLGDTDAGEVAERVDLRTGPIRTIRSARNSPTRSPSNADVAPRLRAGLRWFSARWP